MSFRILIADDEQLERRALAHILAGLADRGIELVEAANGRQAVEAAAGGGIDLAFLDIRMPGMDGLAAARALRRDCPGIHIVFVTAFDQFDYAREALRLGVDEYLVKPAAAGEVLAMARRVLDRICQERRARGSLGDGVQALALLEEELRADLGRDLGREFGRDPGRDEADPSRLASFLRLKGFENRTVAALALRSAAPAAQDSGPTVRRARARGTLELLERRFREAGWYALTGDGETELRCMVVAPAPDASPGLDAPDAIRRILADLATELRSSLGVRILAGACASPDGLPRFREARQAAALARIDRPVVVLSPGTDDDGARAGGGEGPGPGAVERAVAYLREHLAEDLSLADVARSVGTAPSHLSRLFRRHRGETFVQVFCRLRIDAAKRLLLTGNYRVKEAGALVGFKDTAYFCRVFRKYEGVSPAAYLSGSG